MGLVVNVPPFYLTRMECAALIGYGVSGFRKFVARHPDFPRPVQREQASNAPVVYRYAEVIDWLEAFHQRLKAEAHGEHTILAEDFDDDETQILDKSQVIGAC